MTLVLAVMFVAIMLAPIAALAWVEWKVATRKRGRPYPWHAHNRRPCRLPAHECPLWHAEQDLEDVA